MGFLVEFRGVVQGVGFRPLVFRIAERLGVKGFVKNTGFGVLVECDCDEGMLELFLDEINSGLPSIARIDDVKIRRVVGVWSGFRIERS